MKTLILSLILILGLSATNHGKPINDIYSIKDPIAEEESYVDDIPFNTWEIAVESITDGDKTKLNEEPYVDDIPFDTRKIAAAYHLTKMAETTSENNVNDIPFSTEKVVNDYLTGELTAQYRDEANVNDIPCQANATACCYEQLAPVHITIKAKATKKFTLRHKKPGATEYTFTYPVTFEIPRIEWEKSSSFQEYIVIQSSSL